MDKIDFIITWVDGNDENWQEEKAKYNLDGGDSCKSRYRDWEQLKYWFRSVEKYAPWVNKIHFVTWGHLPEWLNVDHPKLNIVNHKNFIPEEYLPVFNSVAIEIHMHRIKGLSDKFVYFCDDFYLMQPCKTTDFFTNGKPSLMAQFIPVWHSRGDIFSYQLYNDYSVCQQYYSRKVIIKNIFKYFNIKYGRIAINNLIQILAGNSFLYNPHICTPFLKSAFEEVWSDNEEIMIKTAKSKFRKELNNSQNLFRSYQIITGNFYPKRIKSIVLNTEYPMQVKEVIENCKCKFMCLGDNTNDDDKFVKYKQIINGAFDKVFPDKCSFEK